MLRICLLFVIFISNVTIADAQRQKLKGSVIDAKSGLGIAKVVVSDGFSVVTTDARGQFQLMAHDAASFVFISTPSGYAIDHVEGVPLFYKRIDSSASYTFSLTREAVDDTKHLLLVGADPQPMTDEDGAKWLKMAENDFRPVLDRYPGIPKIGLMCGDIVGDNHTLYANHKKALKAIGIPFFQVIGNHDVDYDVRSDELSTQTFRANFGPEYYSFNKGKIHYVVLDDIQYWGKHYNYHGYISEVQLAWLEKDLAHVAKGSTVIISVHIPFDFDRSPIEGAPNKYIHEDAEVTNKAHVYKILAPFKVHFMSGHTHWNQQFENEYGYHHIHGAFCGQWWQSPTNSDGTPLGYGVYEVNGDSLTWYYQAAGKPKDYQLRVYPPDSTGLFVANVWNADPTWKIEWWADGKPMGKMTRFLGIDPLIEAHNNALVNAWSWVRPTLTSHMYRAKVDLTVKEIRVLVTDRFGKTYTEKIDLP